MAFASAYCGRGSAVAAVVVGVAEAVVGGAAVVVAVAAVVRAAVSCCQQIPYLAFSHGKRDRHNPQVSKEPNNSFPPHQVPGLEKQELMRSPHYAE